MPAPINVHELPSMDTSMLSCPFPKRLNPSGPLVQEATLRWLKSQDVAVDSRLLDDISEVGLLASHTYPDAPTEALQLASDWSTLFFLLDDFVEEEASEALILERNERVVASLRNEPGHYSEFPVYRALSDVGSRAAKLGGPDWMNHFVQHVRLWLESHLWERRNRSEQRIPTLSEYVAMRQYTIGMYFEFLLSEITDTYRLTARERFRPELLALARMANTEIAWTNDILTLEKELLQGDVHNVVLCLINDDGLSVRDALQRAIEMHDREVEAFMALSQHVVQRGVSEAVHANIRALEHWMGGHMLWASKSKRYEGNRKRTGAAQARSAVSVQRAT